MAAPSTVAWGDKINSKGRIGIDVTPTITNDTCTVKIDVWFWSKYSVKDSANNFYFDNNADSATTNRGSVTIKHTVDTAWSTSNQTCIGSYNYSFSRATSVKTVYCRAKLSDIEYVGATMRASASYTIPALATYTITYNANGGSGAPSSQTKYYGINTTISTVVPTRTGYSFVGWGKSSTTTSVSYNPGGGCGENANITLYAIWKANTYAVSYNANGGSGAPSNQTKTYGVTLTLSSTVPTRTNYVFKGWGTSASTTTVSYSAGGSYTANSAITLYAVWELTYTKPRITNLSVFRCGSDGTASDDGTYFKAVFNWATDKAISALNVNWKQTSTTSWAATGISASGTSGSVNLVFGAGTIYTEYSYDVRVLVSDASGSTTVWKTISAKIYPIDIYKDGKGVAILKPATTSGRLDIGADTYVNGVQVTGNSLVLKGHNTISTTANDTVANWNAQKNASTHYYGISGQLTDQPSTYGILLNYSTGSNLHQIWLQQPSGLMAHRGGNANGWNGTWKTLLDSSNYGTYCVPNTGGTFTGVVTFNSKAAMKNSSNTLGYLTVHTTFLEIYGNATDSVNRTVANRYAWIGYSGNENLCIVNSKSGTIQGNKAWTTSSDKRLKDNIKSIPEEFIDIWKELEPKVFIWNEKNYGNDVQHFGLIAQDVIDAFSKRGLNWEDYGFVNSFTMQEDDTEYFGIAYDEYHMLTSLVLKQTNEKLEEQQKQIDNLQAQIDELKQLLLNN